MKPSPLQLSSIQYPAVEFRANPNADESKLDSNLPVNFQGRVSYDSDGDHFAGVIIEVAGDGAYRLTVEAFATFRIDLEACREAYKQNFNPAVVAVNVLRLLYSSTREFISTVTSRSPWGVATLPILAIEPNDIKLGFEEGRRDSILKAYFGFSDEQIESLNASIQARQSASAEKKGVPKARKGRKSKASAPID